MPTVRDVLGHIERIAPARYAFPGDRIGLQVGSPDQAVHRVAVSLDSSPEAATFAATIEANLLLSHHPLIWDPLKTIPTDRHPGMTLASLIGAKIAFIGAHTNWDAAPGGINDTLARKLGLTDVERFGYANPGANYKLVTFVPAEAVDQVVDALALAGAGRIGNYERCAFTSTGMGTFEGNAESNPTVGQRGRRESVAEVRLEMLVPIDACPAAERAIRATHPYEEPAIDWVVLRDEPGMPFGRIGSLTELMTLCALREVADRALATRSWAWGDPDRVIRRVAVVGGAADGEWAAALAAGADAFLTGEVKQNIAVEASAAGIPILAAGHYATEHPGMVEMARVLGESMPEIDWKVFTPEDGAGGKPW